MEHATLHAAQLIGLLLGLAAPLFALLVLLPAREQAFTAAAGEIGDDLATTAARWAYRAAWIASVATLLNLVVAVAEHEGTTVLAGADLDTLWRFATLTTVGRLALLRALLLAVTGFLCWRLAREPFRARERGEWNRVAATALAATIAMALVSHAAAQPSDRVVALLLQCLHLVSASLWIGVLCHLLAARSVLRRIKHQQEVRFLAALVDRFSPLALLAFGLLATSGAIGAWVYLSGSPKALLASSYGLTLTTKLVLVGGVLTAAYRNYRRVKPALEKLAAANEDEVEHHAPDLVWRFGRTLELEVTAGLLVIVVAGILGSVSPPNGPGQGLLTDRQIAAVLEPRLPATGFGDPKSWLGSSTRTPEDLAHAEFMHNWSGVAVVLLAFGWLLQCLGGRVGEQASRIWPLFLIPFAIFVALFSDPDVWPVGDLGLFSSLGNPLILEHRFGAAMIVLLAWLGLRDSRRGGEERPLGRALPILMIVGSLLLLGHAHSSFASTDALATLIDVQHAILGSIGLLAGVVRWLELRGLFPHSVARVLWPSLVLVLGLFLAFSYREMT